jgi:uncharacterized protein (DUF1800 family)
MNPSRLSAAAHLVSLALAALVASAPVRAASDSMPAPHSTVALSARDSALHVLQRFAFGPRVGQVDEVVREGALAWLDGQLAANRHGDPRLAAIEKRTPALALDPDDWARRFVSMRRAAQQGMAAEERAETRDLLDQVRSIAVTRAVDADDQLREVMASFWFDHFNIFLDKGADRFLLPGYVEDVIRPRALGRFVDLLVATARSPAMLFYLDNVESVAPGTPPPPRAGGLAARRTGINENYARELLELHTLGVDGGYTQHDVVEVARILTGWSMQPPAQGGGFVFRPRVHDFGEKVVLGTRFPAGHGEEEGVRLLRLLARHPATIRHLCTKLCRRFVSDDPPDGCIDAAVAAWRASDGDMREVLRAIAHAPEFWSAGAIGSKVKTPLEFVVSAVRALGAAPDSGARLADAVARLGEPIYRQPSPAGYPDREQDWANSGALLARMNFAVALAAGHEPGAAVDLDAILPATDDHAALVDQVNERILGGAMSAHTRSVIVDQLGDEPDPVRGRALAVGLALGSPEFQRQ